VVCDGSTAFHWRGTVDYKGDIEELGFELTK
jgi:hypothetical protein